MSLTDALADLAETVDRIADRQDRMGQNVDQLVRRPQLHAVSRGREE